MKKRTTPTKLLALLAVIIIAGVGTTNSAFAQTADYWTNKETLQLRYDAYIQFVPNYRTTSTSGYGLVPGQYVKQAYINYIRDGASVIGGRKYTPVATSGYSAYAASAGCWDSILFGDKYTTHFYYGWFYR